ncbi:hypothetical protein NQ314_011152, partial [Rhamnusium bicolor]
ILHGEHSVVYGKLALAASLGLRTKLKLIEINAPNLVVVELPLLDFSYSYDLQKLKDYLLDQPLSLTTDSSEFNLELPGFVHHESLLDRAENFLNYTTGSISLNLSQQMSLIAMFYLLAGILGSVNIDVSSFAFISQTDLKIGAGTGSSASFLVSFAALLMQYVKLKKRNSGNFSKEGYKPCSWDVDTRTFNMRELDMICKWAFCAEKIVHGTPSGIDNTICTYGSMVEFRKGLAPKLLEITCQFRIMLINTNIPRETKKLVSKVARLHEKYPDLTNNILNAMEDVAFIALHHISSLCALVGKEESQVTDLVREHYEELGRLASINHNLLNSLGVSHLKLDEAIQILSENGLQGKLTGAGGGGYATCLIPPFVEAVVIENVVQIFSSRGFQVVITNLGGVGVTVD